MAGRLIALIVGIDAYADDSAPALRGAIADASAVYAFLSRQLGAPAPDLLLLTGKGATRQAILEGWKGHLLTKANAGDQVYFHFSGHGSQAPSIDPDEADGLDETIVAYASRIPGGLDILEK